MAICPGCGSEQHEGGTCAQCKAPLLVDGHALGRLLPSSTAEVDAAGTLYLTADGQRLVRVARTGESERLARERTVLGGLSVDGVPRVHGSTTVDGVGEALLMSAPASPILEHALEGGMRTDATGARRFLAGALTILAELESLSPAVRHRNLSPQTIAWDGQSRVDIIDFSRATDVAADVSGDIVVTALDYAPARAASASARDLYGLGATVVHLLSRRGPRELEDASGVIRFRDEVRVDDRLARFIERLVDAARPGFPSAAAALAELRALDAPPARSSTAPFVLAGVLVVLASTGIGFFSLMRGAPAPAPEPPVAAVEPPPVPEPPPPPSPPPVPGHAKLTITSTPPGASVFLDDKAAGETPLVVEVALGADLNVKVEREGYLPKTRALHVEESLTWDVSLERAPRVRKPRPPKFTDDPNSAILRAIERAVRAQRADVEACDPHGIDRVKFHVVLTSGGALKGLRPLGSGATAASRCVEKVLRDQVRYPSPPGGRDVSADVWLWLTPRFKVAAF
jgi:hypothetical protein